MTLSETPQWFTTE